MRVMFAMVNDQTVIIIAKSMLSKTLHYYYLVYYHLLSGTESDIFLLSSSPFRIV